MANGWTSSRRKRAIDLALGLPALVLLAPVTAAVAAVVRVKHGAPVLHRQARAGRGAEPIRVSKFRSMTNERDGDGDLLPDEDRLTPFGAKLRASSLDELPQLWSVVKGDMSLVGPRPLPLTYVERYSPDQRRRLDVKPGITGWAQVNGRNSSSWPERLAHDVWYVDHASFALDVKILIRTLSIALSRHGVSAEGHVTMPEFMGER